jgi:hypothetical protein
MLEECDESNKSCSCNSISKFVHDSYLFHCCVNNNNNNNIITRHSCYNIIELGKKQFLQIHCDKNCKDKVTNSSLRHIIDFTTHIC